MAPSFRILILDDDPVLQKVLTDRLLAKGHSCFSAGTIAEARVLVNTQVPDLALVDLYLPDGQGNRYCEELRRHHPDMVLLLMTARPGAHDLGAPSEWMVDDFFVKSNHLEELLWRVEVHLAQAARLQARRRREVWLRQLVTVAYHLEGLQEPATLLSRLPAQLRGLPGLSAVHLQLEPYGSFGEVGEGPGTELPLGAEGRVRLWLSPSVEEDLLEALGSLLASALVGAQVFESLQLRQARLERGYLERQRQLARLSHRLDRLSEARDSFLALVSHDLRSPISVVMGHCQLLEEGLLGPAQQRKAFETMRRQTERMSKMVEELLDRYRLGFSGAGEPESGDLTQVAREMVDTFAPVAHRRQQFLLLQSPGPVLVEADLPSLREVLANLIENALRHGPEGATVTVEILPLDGQVQVQVRDQGPGFQSSPDTSGIGLGYRACMRLVAAAGGTIRARTHPGGGQVTVTLPLPIRSSSQGRVCIYCANVDRLERLTEVLGSFWPCSTYTDGTGALESLRREPPSAIVIDTSLRDAISLLHSLKNDADLGAVPVIFVANSLKTVERAHVEGAMSVLRLPLDLDELSAMVRNAMRIQSEARVAVIGRSVDGLTGLDTPEYLDARLGSMLAECRSANRPLPVMLVDVVDMKGVNRSHGWVVGDQLLIWLSGLLRERIGPNDLCGRVGGDGFMLLLPGRDMQDAVELAEELNQFVQRARPRLGVARVGVQISSQVMDARILPPGTALDGLYSRLRGTNGA